MDLFTVSLISSTFLHFPTLNLVPHFIDRNRNIYTHCMLCMCFGVFKKTTSTKQIDGEMEYRHLTSETIVGSAFATGILGRLRMGNKNKDKPADVGIESGADVSKI